MPLPTVPQLPAFAEQNEEESLLLREGVRDFRPVRKSGWRSVPGGR